MDEIRRATRLGRDLAARGAYALARETWKAAQSRAYLAQDRAVLFVLSVNIGEACVRLATQSSDSATVQKKWQLVQEAQANLEYALELVKECGLERCVERYSALYQGVRRAETLRDEVAKLLDAMQVEEAGSIMAGDEKEKVLACATCGVSGSKRQTIVLDESDGCYYCRECYDGYYVALASDAAGDRLGDEAVAGDDAMKVLDNGKWDGCDLESCTVDEDGDAAVGTAASQSRSTVDNVGLFCKTNDERDDDVDGEKSGRIVADRIRYDRVELGSLADFLTGNIPVGDKAYEAGSTRPKVGSSDTFVPVTTAPVDGSHVQVCSKEYFAISDKLKAISSETCPATLDEGGSCNEELKLMDEASADVSCGRRKYSIVRLLELRKVSPHDCPESLLESSVRDDGSVRKQAHSRAGPSRKTSSSKSTWRSAACNKLNGAAVINCDQAKTPEKFEATLSTSPLPSLELCNTLRVVLAEKRLTDDASCHNMMIASGTSNAFSMGFSSNMPIATATCENNTTHIARVCRE